MIDRFNRIHKGMGPRWGGEGWWQIKVFTLYRDDLIGYIGRKNYITIKVNYDRPTVNLLAPTNLRVYGKEKKTKKVNFEFRQNTYNFRIGWSTECRVYRKEWVRGGEGRGGDKLKFSGVVDTLSRLSADDNVFDNPLSPSKWALFTTAG